MKRWCPFLAILLSCALHAQQTPPPEDPSTAQPTTEQSEGEASENNADQESEERGDDTFRPSQEISEDYPVPLPVDI